MPRPVRLIAIVVLLSAHLLPAAALAQGQATFSLRPANPDPSNPGSQGFFVYSLAAGATKSDAVEVLNTGSAPITVDIYPADATTGSGTGAVYANRDTPASGVGGWIRLSQARVTVPAGATTSVPFSVQVPANSKPGEHLAGIAAQLATAAPTAALEGSAASKETRFQVTTVSRVVLSVVVTVPGPVERKIAVTGVTPRVNDTETQLLLGVRNDGNVMVKPRGELIVRSQDGAERARIPVGMETILPGDTAEFAAPWPPSLPAGDYLIAATLDTSDSLAKGGSSGATFQPAHAEYQPTRPVGVRPPVLEVIPNKTPGGPQTVVVRRPETSGTLPTWWPYAAGGIVVLILVNGLLAYWFLRARRAPVGGPSAPAEQTTAAMPEPQAAPPPTSVAPAPMPMRAPAAVPPPTTGAPLFVKGRGATIFLLRDGVKRPFVGWGAFIAHGGTPNLSNVRLMPEDVLNALPTGDPIVAPEDARAS
jgi:hypothetical protein